MRLLIPLTLSIIFMGCGDKNHENSSNSSVGNSSITINKIEKTITQKETSIGCEHQDDENLEECNQNSNSSAQFILATLSKDLDSNRDEDIQSIKENLDLSLEEILKEENEKNKLKDSLEALVDRVANKNSKANDLKNFVSSISDNEFSDENEKILGTPTSSKISSIREEIINLVDLETSTNRPEDVKKRLESLIESVTKEKRSLLQTQKSIRNLVKEAEKKNTPSVKKFANAIIKDVANKKISIIEENSKYFVIRVQQGDNLSILAKRYYNDKRKYRLIYDANRDKINSKYEIFPNSTLLIPKI